MQQINYDIHYYYSTELETGDEEKAAIVNIHSMFLLTKGKGGVFLKSRLKFLRKGSEELGHE